MPRLLVLDGANRGALFEVHGGETRLGRDPELEVPLFDDKASRRHALILAAEGGWKLKDLESRNGTSLNGLPVAEAALVHGDQVRIGGTILLFVDDEAACALPGASALRTTLAGTQPAVPAVPAVPAAAAGAVPVAAQAPAQTPTPPPPARPPAPAPALPIPREGTDLLGDSPAMKAVFSLVLRAAPTDATCLLVGESGTGKELVARALHAVSRRRTGPFIPVNCAALPEALLESELFGHEKGAFTGALARRAGRLEQASGGTLFLDEIGEMSPAVQAKCLRALESGEYSPLGGTQLVRADLRLVAATNRDLDAAVAEGRFRKDLLFRLRVVELRLPPLRERVADIPVLATHFFEVFRRKVAGRLRRIAPDTMERLAQYAWPGNVRELRNVLERAVILAEGPDLSIADLPLEVQAGLPAGDGPEPLALRELERRQILRVLRMTGGNKKEAARLLGIDRKTLHARVKEYGVGGGGAGESAGDEA
ncbi:MAG: sigma 54-dependent Fis family transcriptional regulator [Planctomycetes bacterium]|nr:sigma 54-dependent Fis family transcriptional regulator [Planctomycetota bacterium]